MMKKTLPLTRRRLLKLGAASAGVYLFQSCTAAAAGAATAPELRKPVTITFASWDAAEDAFKEGIVQLIADFQKQNPGITIKSVPTPFNAIREQLIIQAAGGTPPDVAQSTPIWTLELADKGVLEPLDALAGSAFLADNHEAGLRAGTLQGKLYATPFALLPIGFYYDRDLMTQARLDPSKPPKTLAELNTQVAQARPKLPASADALGVFTAKAPFTMAGMFPFMWMHGANPISGGKANFATAEMAAFVRWLKDALDKKYVSPSNKFKEYREMMANGRVMLTMDHQPGAKGAVQAINKGLGDAAFYKRFGLTAMPAGASGKPIHELDMTQLMIFKKAADKEAAWKWVQYLTSSEASIRMYHARGGMPLLKSTLNKYPALYDNPHTKFFMNDIMATAQTLPLVTNWASLSEIMTNGIQSILFEGKPVEATLAETDKQVQARLK